MRARVKSVLCSAFTKYVSVMQKKCHYKFCKNNTVLTVPCKRSVYRKVGTYCVTASVLGISEIQKVVFFLDQM